MTFNESPTGPAVGTPRGQPTTHGACGQWWRQRGNLTGHCSGCCYTFGTGQSFDAHQATYAGAVECFDPALKVKPDGSSMFAASFDGLTWVWTYRRESGSPAETPFKGVKEQGVTSTQGSPCTPLDCTPPELLGASQAVLA